MNALLLKNRFSFVAQANGEISRELPFNYTRPCSGWLVICNETSRTKSLCAQFGYFLLIPFAANYTRGRLFHAKQVNISIKHVLRK